MISIRHTNKCLEYVHGNSVQVGVINAIHERARFAQEEIIALVAMQIHCTCQWNMLSYGNELDVVDTDA